MSRFALPKLRFNSQGSSYGASIMLGNLDDMMKLREKCKHFRVLIIGRANAGKTTILQKICNTNEEARIQDPSGKTIPLSTILPSNMRGLHDIEKELVFPSNPGFVFHDSQGIEAGGTKELDIVKNFIAKRAKAKKLEDRLHVIWYCIPVDNDRMFTAAENSFFDNLGDGPTKDKAPVIAIFTKFDHRDIGACMSLQQEGLDFPEAKEKAAERAKEEFEKDYLPILYKRKYPPKKHVYLRDMDQPEASISELAERTAEVLESGILKLMFVSTQKSSIALCTKYAMELMVVKWCSDYRRKSYQGPMPLIIQSDLYRLACHILVWFPYDLNNLLDSENAMHRTKAEEFDKYGGYGLANQANDIQEELEELAGAHPATNRICRLGVALCIIAEHSYSFLPLYRLKEAVKAYLASPSPKAVDQTVNQVLKDRISDSDLGDTLIKMTAEHSLLTDI